MVVIAGPIIHYLIISDEFITRWGLAAWWKQHLHTDYLHAASQMENLIDRYTLALYHISDKIPPTTILLPPLGQNCFMLRRRMLIFKFTDLSPSLSSRSLKVPTPHRRSLNKNDRYKFILAMPIYKVINTQYPFAITRLIAQHWRDYLRRCSICSSPKIQSIYRLDCFRMPFIIFYGARCGQEDFTWDENSLSQIWVFIALYIDDITIQSTALPNASGNTLPRYLCWFRDEMKSLSMSCNLKTYEIYIHFTTKWYIIYTRYFHAMAPGYYTKKPWRHAFDGQKLP